MGLLAKADCQRLIAESLPKCFGCGYAALCLSALQANRNLRFQFLQFLQFAVLPRKTVSLVSVGKTLSSVQEW